MNKRYLLISAAIAGTLAALLSAVPVVNFVNCLLCGWLWAQGIAAVWMYRYNTGEIVNNQGGIVLGAISGLFGAGVAALLSAFTWSGPEAVPAELMTQLEQYLGSVARLVASPSTGLLVNIVINLVMYPLFGAIGGLLGANLMRPKSV